MKKSITLRRIIFYTLSFLILLLLLSILVPRSYNVPKAAPDQRVQYWDLKGGSRIAFIQVKPVIETRPFPVIYLHGGPGGAIREHSIQLLSNLAKDGFTVYLYDQVGGGYSERLDEIGEYTVDRHLSDLEEIVDKIGAEKVILIAQSWGAILATQFIAYHPHKVEKLILTGPGPILPISKSYQKLKSPDSLNLKKPASTNADANRKASNLRMKFVKAWAITTGKKIADDSEVDAWQSILGGELNKSIVCDIAKAPKASAGSGFYCQLMTIKSFSQVKDPRPDLKHSTCKVLIMKGQCDNQPWGVTAEYLNLLPDCRLKVIPSAGHMIEIEQPSEYLRIISEFLSETP
ncbi:MAG: alpha/beta hydrolase [Bacteroidales bacterium]|nr:alpha/beta hydrolase [Bacteroidales bacterium]